MYAIRSYYAGIESITSQEKDWRKYIDLLSLMMDRRYDTGSLRRSSLLSLIDQALLMLFVDDFDRSGDLILHSAEDPIPDCKFEAFFIE